MDLTPEQTTATGVRASAARSAETSQDSRAPDALRPAPGGEDPDTRLRREVGGRRDGGGTVAPRGGSQREVPDRELRYTLARSHQLQFRGIEADLRYPADHTYGSGHGAFTAYDLLCLVGQLQVVGTGQAVGDESRLQGHDGYRPAQCFRDPGAEHHRPDRFVACGFAFPHSYSLRE